MDAAGMAHLKALLLVAAGGALGSAARYLLSGWVLHHTVDWRFPLGTFLVNVLGCLAVGILGGLVVKHDFFSPEVRLLLFTGIAGGFTTFSAFGVETFYLLRRGEILVAGGYVGSSVVVGLAILWAGFALVSARG
jgi:CrcB protein